MKKLLISIIIILVLILTVITIINGIKIVNYSIEQPHGIKLEKYLNLRIYYKED